MVNHMKTTVQIPDPLFEEARKVAQREKTTLKALIEKGLRKVLSEYKQPNQFKLRNASFKGNGLQSHLGDETWDQIRSTSYEGRGG